MKKVMMTKYGFVRWPEEDFNDDGNAFTCYKVGERVRVSKCTYRGDVFISARIEGSKLPYEVYSKLPHYEYLDSLNGISIVDLTDEDLSKLYTACLAYELECNEAENTIKFPTLEEIKEQCIKIQAKRFTEIAHIETLLGTNVTKLALTLSDYKWRNVKEYITKLTEQAVNYDPENYASRILDTAFSFTFCSPTYSELDSCYWYRALLEIINSIQD